jgi:hypothetical protein
VPAAGVADGEGDGVVGVGEGVADWVVVVGLGDALVWVGEGVALAVRLGRTATALGLTRSAPVS